MSNDPLLLDTHCWLWMELGLTKRLGRAALSRIRSAELRGELRVSVISIWELGMLEKNRRIALPMNVRLWVDQLLKNPVWSLVALTPEIALESVQLPGSLHGDPADRIIVATARVLNATLLTKDQRLIEYSEQRHVKVLEA